jgi:hypothetical protein
MPLDLFASTLPVYASAVIAKMHPALTVHMITPVRLLNPNFTFRALLELTALDELKELHVVFIGFDCPSKLSATLSRVEWNHATETIMFLTGFTFKFMTVRLVKDKCVAAVWSWAPTHIRQLIYRLCCYQLAIFKVLILSEDLSDIQVINIKLTFSLRTHQGESPAVNLRLEVLDHTV